MIQIKAGFLWGSRPALFFVVAALNKSIAARRCGYASDDADP
jgi:hypothetical protein